MSTVENKVAVRRCIDIFNTTDSSAFDELCSPDIAATLRGVMTTLPFSEHHMEVTQMVAEDDKVMVLVATRGVHSGEWQGIPATGRRWTNTGAEFFRLADGKIVEMVALFDELGHLKQLGATVSAPPGSSKQDDSDAATYNAGGFA